MSKLVNRLSLNLKHEAILKKKFKTNLAGYDPREVDQFLDLVIGDYKSYENYLTYLSAIIQEKIQLINDKDEEISKLKIEISQFQERINHMIKNSSNKHLYDRLDQIEKKLKDK